MSVAKKICLGLELGGSKSSRTSLVALEYYAKERKAFLIECFPHLKGDRILTGDEVLLKTLEPFPRATLAVHAPLTLPPCSSCTVSRCPGADACEVPSVQWMYKEAKKKRLPKQKYPTPYTQRPVDVQMGLSWQKRFPIPWEETLGAGLAPITMRMQYLRKQMSPGVELVEFNPRLALIAMAKHFKISARELRLYRQMERGYELRLGILEKLSYSAEDGPNLFLYEQDMRLVAREISLFDSLLGAWVAVFHEEGMLEPMEFNEDWGAIAVPAL